MTKTKITKEEVEKIADLARIHLTPEEIAKFAEDLSSILDYVDQINEVETGSLDYESHVDLKNITRDDVTGESFTQKDSLLNRKDQIVRGHFTISTVLDKK